MFGVSTGFMLAAEGPNTTLPFPGLEISCENESIGSCDKNSSQTL